MSFVLDYPLNQAPSDGLRQALLQARCYTKDALFDRDMETQRLVMDEYNIYSKKKMRVMMRTGPLLDRLYKLNTN